VSFLIGLSAGVFGGLIGGGGGVIMIPLMVSILKLDQHTAHGISLVALVFTGIVGAATYAYNGSVDVTASLFMAVTAIITAYSGAHFANSLSEWKLKRSFGGFLIFVSITLLFKSYLSQLHAPFTGWMKIVLLLVTGAFTGFLSGMMGVGGGAIMIPMMVLFAGFGQHLAQGSSLLAMVPAGSVGAYTHWKLGNVRTDVLRGLIPGIFIGTLLGGIFAHLLSDTALRTLFAFTLTCIGVRSLRAKRSPNGNLPPGYKK
jgi:uncharacterized membrane protein YfcA